MLASASSGSAFQNGSFETVVPGSGHEGTEAYYAFDRTPDGIMGWTVSGPDGNDSLGNAPAGVTRYDPGQVPDGAVALLLGWLYSGSIRQTFDTVAGHIYRVDFALSGNPYWDIVNTLDFTAPGVATQFTFDVTGKTAQDMGWVQESAEFVAASSSSTIMFSSWDGYNLQNYSGPIIDAVSVTLVPEPCTLLALTFGLVGVIARRRK